MTDCYLNNKSVVFRKQPEVIPSVTKHRQLNRILDYLQIRYGIPLPKALKQASVL